MAASSQSMSVPPAIPATPVASRRPLALAVAQRAMPLVTASAGIALATLAAERAIASLALRAAERTGLRQALAPAATPAPLPVEAIEALPRIMRITVTRTTVVERITTRRS